MLVDLELLRDCLFLCGKVLFDYQFHGLFSFALLSLLFLLFSILFGLCSLVFQGILLLIFSLELFKYVDEVFLTLLIQIGLLFFQGFVYDLFGLLEEIFLGIYQFIDSLLLLLLSEGFTLLLVHDNVYLCLMM
jgi:hypothetical protein